MSDRDTVAVSDELLMLVLGRRPLLDLFPEYDAAVGCYRDPETDRYLLTPLLRLHADGYFWRDISAEERRGIVRAMIERFA